MKSFRMSLKRLLTSLIYIQKNGIKIFKGMITGIKFSRFYRKQVLNHRVGLFFIKYPKFEAVFKTVFPACVGESVLFEPLSSNSQFGFSCLQMKISPSEPFPKPKDYRESEKFSSFPRKLWAKETFLKALTRHIFI